MNGCFDNYWLCISSLVEHCMWLDGNSKYLSCTRLTYQFAHFVTSWAKSPIPRSAWSSCTKYGVIRVFVSCTEVAANNKGADQTARIHRLICALVVRTWRKWFISWLCDESAAERRHVINILFKCFMTTAIKQQSREWGLAFRWIHVSWLFHMFIPRIKLPNFIKG